MRKTEILPAEGILAERTDLSEHTSTGCLAGALEEATAMSLPCSPPDHEGILSYQRFCGPKEAAPQRTGRMVGSPSSCIKSLFYASNVPRRGGQLAIDSVVVRWGAEAVLEVSPYSCLKMHGNLLICTFQQLGFRCSYSGESNINLGKLLHFRLWSWCSSHESRLQFVRL